MFLSIDIDFFLYLAPLKIAVHILLAIKIISMTHNNLITLISRSTA